MTVVRPNSIAGINSITVQSGQALNIHDASGNLIRSLTNSSGISTFASVEITKGTGDLKVGISTFFVDQSAGRIGINTDVPDRALHVTVADAPSAKFGGGTHFIELGQLATSSSAGLNIVGGSNMLFRMGGTEAMRIDSSGQLVIGSTSGEAKLDVTGGVSISSNGATVTPSGYDLKIRSNTSKLGIHCDSGSGTPILEFGTGGSTGCCIFNADATPMRLGTVNTERMRIRGDGRISVGSSLAVTGVCTAAAFVPSEGQLSNKNLIINGGMEICQRFAVNTANNLSNSTHTYHVDRFKAYSSAAGGILQAEWEDDNASDAGFQYSVKYSCVDADTSLANDEMVFISQVVELKNMKHLGYGLSWAKTCTLSFYAKSSLTGTYAIALINEGTNNRQYVTEFTISDTNWNRYTITIPGDTSGTWSSNGLRVAWCLAAASNRQTSTLGSWQTSGTAYYGTSNTVNFMSSASSRSFSLTGVQLEVGSYVTPYEHRSYDDEFKRCQRYYQDWQDWTHYANRGADSNYDGHIIIDTLRIDMRANPTITSTVYGWIANGGSWVDGSSSEAASLHSDPSSDYPGRYVKVTGAWSWDTNSQETIAVKFVTAKFNAEL